jgi:hypothetical protein
MDGAGQTSASFETKLFFATSYAEMWLGIFLFFSGWSSSSWKCNLKVSFFPLLYFKSNQ